MDDRNALARKPEGVGEVPCGTVLYGNLSDDKRRSVVCKHRVEKRTALSKSLFAAHGRWEEVVPLIYTSSTVAEEGDARFTTKRHILGS